MDWVVFIMTIIILCAVIWLLQTINRLHEENKHLLGEIFDQKTPRSSWPPTDHSV